MKVRAYHRSNRLLRRFRAGSFFSEVPVDDSYGRVLHIVNLTVQHPAGDADVLRAALDIGLFCPDADLAYEYLSSGLIDSCVSQADVANVIALLMERGFDSARVTDFVVPHSWVIFNPAQAKFDTAIMES